MSTPLDDALTPSLLLQESDPADLDTPAAGQQRTFIRESDGHFCRIDSDDLVTDIEAGGGGAGGAAISGDLSYESLKRGLAGVGVISGCTPTAQGSPDMTVAIAAGICMIGAVPVPVAVTGANATISSADTTDPRIDLISINSSGTIVVTAGTPAATPTAPTLPSNSALIAQISVPANDTTISSGQITDARILLRPGWVQIEQIVTAGSQSTVDFTNIPAGFKDLKITFLSQDTAAGTGSNHIRLKMNNDGTSGNYTTMQRIAGTNTVANANSLAASAGGAAFAFHPNAGNTGLAATGEVVIPGYDQTVFHKRFFSTFTSDDGSGIGSAVVQGAAWSSTAAITRITVTTDGTAFTDGSTFTLSGLI